MDIQALKNEIVQRLELQAAAEDAARTGMPASDSSSLSGDETGIIAEASKCGKTEIEKLNSHCKEIDQTIRECRQACQDSQQQRRQFIPAPQPQDNLAAAARAAEENAVAACNQFKHDNNLRRDPTGDDRLTQITWVVVVVIVEGMFNSYFFAPASGHGLFGGFATALFIGVVNVGFAFVGGVLGLRYAKNHCNPVFNLTGLAWFLLCMSVCFLMISMATLYRGHLEILQTEDWDSEIIANEANRRAIESLVALNIKELFGSVNSVILFFIGALCAMAGVWKGYEYDDPYPGYGHMWRQKIEAEERHKEAVREHNARRREWLQGNGSKIQGTKIALNKAVNNLRTKQGVLSERIRDMSGIADEAAQLASVLLQFYRSWNSRIRASKPPAYFGTFPTRDDFSLLTEQSADIREQARKMMSEADQMIEECDQEIREVQRVLDAKS